MSLRLHFTYPRRTHHQNFGFFPHNCPVSASSSTSAATMAARALAEALLHLTPTPFAILGDNQFAAIQALSSIFSNVTVIPPTAPAPMAPHPAPAVAFQPDYPAPSPRVPKLTPTAFPPRVTILPAENSHNNPSPPTCVYRPSPSRTMYK